MSSKKRHATVIGVPLDYGASKRGASGGTAAIRRANLIEGLEGLDLEVPDAGDLPVPKTALSAQGKLKNAAPILKVCRELEEAAYEAVKRARRPSWRCGRPGPRPGSSSPTRCRTRRRP